MSAPTEPLAPAASAGRGRTSLAAWGTALNVVALLLPVIALGRLPAMASDGRVLVFLAGASALCFAELRLVARPDGKTTATPVPVLARADARLALSTGLTLLAVFWAGLLERALGGSSVVALDPRAAWLGGAAMAGGVALRAWAIVTLGPWFDTAVRVRAGQPLVTHGPYAVMCHPSEVGLLVAALGSGLVLGSPLSLALVACVLGPLGLVRVGREEQALCSAFGPWRTRAQPPRTGRLRVHEGHLPV